jgi:serine-type D-Ala-D-Ala carboxypeptidase
MAHPRISLDRRRLLLGLSAMVLAPACGSAEFNVQFSASSNMGGFGPLVPVKPESVDMSSAAIAEVFARMDARVKAGKYPGATAMICRQGKIVGEHAVGSQVRGTNDPVTIDTIFDMMSVTKVMATAIAAMVLVDQGKLGLDDPVVKHLPKFTGKGKDRVTVRQMLSYSSGLPLENNVFGQAPEKIWEIMALTNLEYEPGTKVEYSDLGYRLLGKIIENVAGKNLDEFTREFVWKPLGMTNTMYAPPASLIAKVAETGPTGQRTQKLRGVVQDDQDFALGGIVGCDGLFSTAKDAAVFCQMMLNGGIYDGKRILSAALAAEMVKNQTPFVNVDQSDTSPLMNLLATPKGYGWELATPRHSNGGTRMSRNAFGKAGGTGTFMWVDPPRQIIAVLLTNRGLPVPFDEPGWNKLLEDAGNVEFFNGVMAAVTA